LAGHHAGSSGALWARPRVPMTDRTVVGSPAGSVFLRWRATSRGPGSRRERAGQGGSGMNQPGLTQQRQRRMNAALD